MLKYQLIVLGVLILFSSSIQMPSIGSNAIVKEDSQLNSNNSTEEIAEILKFLEIGRNELEFKNNTDNIFLIGLTGTGKTTIGLILTSDNSKLRSENLVDKRGKPLKAFRIVDETNLISTKTVTSKTILPQLFTDEVSNVTYYDCAGYGDTRNATVDITATFFVKDVIDLTQRVKFLIVVTHETVKADGGSRTEFLKLTAHISRFMKNIKKFKNGIGLLVNMVDQSDSRTVEDDIANVVSFLEETKDELIPKINDKPHYKDAVDIIDILLHETEEKYDRITILYKAKEAGIISKMPLIQNCRNAVYEMAYNTLKYVEKEKDDFGYTISEDSQNTIYKLNDDISKKIVTIVTEIDDAIVNYFTEKETDESLDMNELENIFYKAHIAIKGIIEKATELNTIEKFKKEILNTIEKTNVPIPSTIISDLNNKINFYNFMQNVSTSTLAINPVEWVHNLGTSNRYLDNTNKFYTFLPELYNKLSTYKYQNNKNEYNIEIKSDNDFNSFVSKVDFNNMKNTKLNTIKKERLNKILEWTVRSKIAVNCNAVSKTLKVTGNIVLLSDVTSDPCYANSKYIRVFAMKSIIFNQPITKTNQAQLSIIAPNWNVLSATNINLSGVEGYTRKDAAAVGQYSGQKGGNGRAGGNGGNSGHFFGIASEFENGNNLKVILNGGNAGNGQNGGNGFILTNRVVDPPSGKKDDHNCDGRLSGFKYRKVGGREETSDMDSFTQGFVTGISIGIYQGNTHYYKQQYKLYGDCGGSGGDGGKNGIPGQNGVFDIIALKGGNSQVKTESISGKPGSCGKEGQSGENSKVTTTHCYSVHAHEEILFGAFGKDEWQNEFKDNSNSSTEHHIYCSAVQYGARCRSTDGYDSRNPIELLDRKTPVEQFQQYFESNMNDSLRKHILEEFLNIFKEKTKSII